MWSPPGDRTSPKTSVSICLCVLDAAAVHRLHGDAAGVVMVTSVLTA